MSEEARRELLRLLAEWDEISRTADRVGDEETAIAYADCRGQLQHWLAEYGV